MNFEQLLLTLLSVACACIGWFARELFQAVQKLRADLSSLEVRIGTDYIRYDRLQDAMRPIKEALDEIKHALVNKQDKA